MSERALIYSPSLDGHRHVYCRAIADVLTAEGYEVTVAGAFGRVRTSAVREALRRLRERDGATFVDTSGLPRGGHGVDLETLRDLIAAQGASLTVLAEADEQLALLAAQIAPGRRLPGRRVGVFLRSTKYVHAGRDADPWRNRVGRWRRGRVAWPHDPYVFHEHLLPRFRLLDAALCLDEVFVAGHGYPHVWLPDMFTGRDAEDWRLSPDEEVVLERLAAFGARLAGRPLVVYFGTAHRRRGYTALLRLAADVDGGFVHAGAPATAADPEAESMRATLRDRGDLFETGAYLPSYAAAERVLAAGHSVPLPYHRHFVSSGVMLQALAAGRPVVVPDCGLMAWRTRSFGLGCTYAAGDGDGLRRAFLELDGGADDGAERRRRFLSFFSPEAVTAAVRYAIGVGASPAPLPAPGLVAVEGGAS